MGIASVSILSALLGAVSYAVGTLPLLWTISKSRIGYLSTVGTGLLLGAALGIIIPEGIEAVISTSNGVDPSKKIALSLLSGFTLMLFVEQLSSGHDHEHQYKHVLPLSRSLEILNIAQDSLQEHSPRLTSTYRDSDDASTIALAQLEHREMGLAPDGGNTEAAIAAATAAKDQTRKSSGASAWPLTIGLVIHSLADGLALGASALPRTGQIGQETTPGPDTRLSLVVFLAIAIHKAPAALGFSMSLLSRSIQPSECKKYIGIFSASTPLGTILSYSMLSTLRAGNNGSLPGFALLVSGGSFLYVATVLQPISHQSNDMSPKTRVALLTLGMFMPFCVSLITDHE